MRYFAMIDTEALADLGEHDCPTSAHSAADDLPVNVVWVFSEEGLNAMFETFHNCTKGK